MGAGHQQDQGEIRGSKLSTSPHPSLHQSEKGWSLNSITKGQRCKQSCLCNEASIQSPDSGFQIFLVGEHIQVLGGPNPTPQSPPCPGELFTCLS